MGKSVSDGKTLVANAITAKGISTATDASFQTIAENIGKLVNGNLSLVTWGTSTTFEYDCEIGDILVFTSMSTIYVYSGLEELFNKGVGNDHHVAVCKCTSTHIKCGGRTDKDFSELYALFRIS